MGLSINFRTCEYRFLINARRGLKRLGDTVMKDMNFVKDTFDATVEFAYDGYVELYINAAKKYICENHGFREEEFTIKRRPCLTGNKGSVELKEEGNFVFMWLPTGAIDLGKLAVILHEVGHLTLDYDYIGTDEIIEANANNFAKLALMPYLYRKTEEEVNELLRKILPDYESGGQRD